jgi:hypothetical protein
MRTASRAARAPRKHHQWKRFGLAILVTGLVVVAACGPSGPTGTPTAVGASGVPTPQPTPNLHIEGSVDANRVFQILAAARLAVHQETLQGAGPKGEPNATLFIVDGSIPVSIDQFSSPAAVRAAGYTAGSRTVKGDAPYTLWAANIVIHVGNRQGAALPAGPDAATQAAANEIARVVDPYLGPLTQRSVAPLVLPSTPEPAATAEPTPTPAPTAVPTASPKPSAKPTAKPKPKPTKKP